MTVEDRPVDWCCTAVGALPTLFKALPQYADEPLFEECCKRLWIMAHHNDKRIYQAAAHALVASIQAMHQRVDVHKVITHQVLPRGGDSKESKASLLTSRLVRHFSALLQTSGHLGKRCAAASVLSALVAIAPQDEKESVCEQVLKVLCSQLGTNQDATVRSVIIARLGELAQAVPAQAGHICERLLPMAADSNTIVRRAVMEVLGTLDGGSRHHGRVRRVLMKAARGSDAAVRKAAARALGARVWAGQCLDRECLQVLLTLNRDRDSSVRDAAMAALSGFSTQQLIEEYCNGLNDNVLVTQIRGRLCTQSLVESPSRRGYYQLTLHRGVGEPIVWEAPMEEIDRLKRAIRRQNPTLSWTEYIGLRMARNPN